MLLLLQLLAVFLCVICDLCDSRPLSSALLSSPSPSPFVISQSVSFSRVQFCQFCPRSSASFSDPVIQLFTHFHSHSPLFFFWSSSPFFPSSPCFFSYFHNAHFNLEIISISQYTFSIQPSVEFPRRTRYFLSILFYITFENVLNPYFPTHKRKLFVYLR